MPCFHIVEAVVIDSETRFDVEICRRSDIETGLEGDSRSAGAPEAVAVAVKGLAFDSHYTYELEAAGRIVTAQQSGEIHHIIERHGGENRFVAVQSVVASGAGAYTPSMDRSDPVADRNSGAIAGLCRSVVQTAIGAHPLRTTFDGEKQSVSETFFSEFMGRCRALEHVVKRVYRRVDRNRCICDGAGG